MGLSDVLPDERLRVEARRQAEQREQRLGAEEERELDDAAVLDLEHLQRPRVVALAGLARLVLAERGRAVRGRRRDDARAAAADAGAEPPGRGCRRGRCSQRSNGGIDCVASSWISDVSASMS